MLFIFRRERDTDLRDRGGGESSSISVSTSEERELNLFPVFTPFDDTTLRFRSIFVANICYLLILTGTLAYVFLLFINVSWGDLCFCF